MKKNMLSLSALLLSAIIGIGFILNVKLAVSPLLSNGTPISFSDYTETVSSKLKSDISFKNSFLDLNGLFYVLSGRRVCNQVIRLNNGFLSNASVDFVDQSPLVQSVKNLSDYASERGADLIFVLAPYKLDREKALLPTGTYNYANENADALVAALSENGLDCIDLRPYTAESIEQIEKYFFATDHHWNYQGAFVGFSKLMEFLQKKYPDDSIDMSCADMDNWSAFTLEDAFFGSFGKRTGVLFSDWEDMVYYLPKFETEMSMSICDGGSENGSFFEGDFRSTVVRDKFFVKRLSPFVDSLYHMYVGGEYELVTHECTSAASDRRLMIIKDSFAIPVEAYLSTAFKHIDAFDPRASSDKDVFDYIDEFKPDTVIMMISTGTLEAYGSYIFQS